MNKIIKNPYAKALDGLVIEDPVLSFLIFVKKEKIRLKRENNFPQPWSSDPVFQKGRFLNVFREDDRVSKSIIKFCSAYENDLPRLIQALFFARWCNKQEIIDEISARELLNSKALNRRLLQKNNWCILHYPVEEIQYSDKIYNRLDTLHFYLMK